MKKNFKTIGISCHISPGYLDVSLILVHGELLYDGVYDVLDPGPLILLPAHPAGPVGAVVVLVHGLQPANIVVTVSHQVDVQLVRGALRTTLGRRSSPMIISHIIN